MSWRDGAGKCQPSEQTLALMDKKNAAAREAVIEQAIADFYPAWERRPDLARFIAAALSQAPATWAVGNWTPEAIERMRQLSKPATDGAGTRAEVK